MINTELKEQNYALFIKKLNQVGVNTDALVARLGDKLLNATYGLDVKSNVAYDGSLINVILRTMTPIALKLNELLDENVRVEKDSLIKVCLLYQISKAEMFIPNDNDWEVEKRGLVYKYAENKLALKMCMKSLILCQECGITFTAEEIEALTILDRDSDDAQAKFFASPFATIIKSATEITNLKNRVEC